MLINNPDALKGWLVVVLEPLCDADSSALARYVLALLKKDKPEKELKMVMIEQLDVFLSEETAPFVERLFEAISSDEYLTAPPPFDTDGAIPTAAVKEILIKTEIKTETNDDTGFTDTTPTIAIEDKIQFTPIDEPKIKEPDNNGSLKLNDAVERTAQFYDVNHMYTVSPPIRAIADKENLPRESRRRRASLRSRSRSRSCSHERISRRSRSRDRRANEREKIQRQFRNKSPPLLDSRHIGSHDRRRGGVVDRRRMALTNDDRSPRFGGSGGESSRKGRINCSKSRSPSPSLERGRGKGSPVMMRTARVSPDRHHNLQHECEKRQRCRDFDEKGYCVRGETCPWDHGINPVVFEGLNKTALISMSLREYNPDAPDLWTRTASSGIANSVPASIGAGPGSGIGGPVIPGGINPFTGAARPGSMMMGVGGNVPIGYPHLSSSVDKSSNGSANYTRSAGAGGGGFRAAAPMIPFPFNPASVTTLCQRELIPIPVVDANATAGGDVSSVHPGKRRYELEDSVAIADGPTKRKVPLNSRLGPRLPSNNCSLELRKVPRGLNTIAHLNNHFAKFGKIVNIQISYEGDPEAAIVTFSTHAEANVAYRSTEAVLNNRFIKVFWHTQEFGSSNSGENSNMQMSGGRKNSQYHLNNVPAVPTPSADSAKTSNATLASQSTIVSDIVTTNVNPAGVEPTAAGNTQVAATHANPPSLRLKNTSTRGSPQVASTAIIRKKQEEQAKAVVQLANGLRKRKQELLQGYVKQMKSALELVERCEPNDPQRVKTLATIKVLQGTIDKQQKEIAAEQEQMQAQIQIQQPPQPKKTKEQQKKELLDIELELIAQQQEGNSTNTSAIQKRLEELQRNLGIVLGNTPTGTPGQGAVPGAKVSHFNRQNSRARTTYPEGSTRVDRRPKTIIVAGFTSEEADFVLGHFKHFGEITKHDVDKNIPQLILSYATRINAEQAVLRGKIFKDKRLQVSWAPIVPTSLAATLTENKSALLDDLSAEDAIMPANLAAKPIEVTLSETDALNTDTLPELRLEDEEEDEESEDRSWRR